MLDIVGKSFQCCDGVTRRSFLRAGALTLGGLSLSDVLRARAAAPASSRPKSVILFWMDGGPTHMETYDMKPDAPAEFRGPLDPIRTRVPGLQVCELLPGHARLMDKISVVRSVHHNNGDHFAAAHWMTTGYHGSTAANMDPMYPSVGSYIARLRGPNKEGMPAYVGLPQASTVGITPGYFSATYLGAAYNPFQAGDGRVKGNLSPSVEAARLQERVDLLSNLDTLRRDMDKSGLMDGMDTFNRQAVSMVLSGSARKALDVTLEPQKIRDFYGTHGWAQSALGARRLVEAGVTFVTVSVGGWDDHANIDGAMKSKLPPFDRAVSCLVQDLSERGMLDDVLVMAMGEFGRTPRLNKGLAGGDARPGRDHWGEAMSVMMAGGGVKGGMAVGSTDERGERPKDRPVGPGDILATVYEIMGVDRDRNFLNHSGRPVPVLHKGEPIKELLG